MKRVLFYLLFLSFISCSYKTNLSEFSITSPKENWTYFENEEIYFSTDIISPYLKWYSSIDGFLDSKSHFCKKLSAGQHEISLYNSKSKILKKLIITIKNQQSTKEKEILLINFPYTFKPASTCGFYSLSGSAKISENTINQNDNRITRDIKLNTNIKNKTLITYNNRQCDNTNHNNFFYVINTNNQTEANLIETTLYYSNENINIYIEKNNSDTENLDKCIENITHLILPRIKDIWGSVEDINHDNKLTILFSSTINKEKKAIGFFNQDDFFLRNDNINSKDYNPYSNEMDIIYVAFPENSNKNYSIESISATIAHEISHAANFSKKTYLKIKQKKPFTILDTFLDEGLSHLTENLVGFGSSGGNKDFINAYLKNSNICSFCSSNILGEQDTVERRGAMSLFLFFLFNKAGGFDWADNKINLLDKGGISFLKKIISSEDNSWDSIGSYFNISTDLLFQEFCRKCLTENLYNIFDFNKTDIMTGERIFECNEFKKYDINNINTILDYSITKLNPINNELILSSNLFYGNTYFIFLEE